MYRLSIFGMLLLIVVACGTTPQRPTTERKANSIGHITHEEVDYDSLIMVLDARYNELCEERKRAYSERDSLLRTTLLEANDRASQALSDSLRWVLRHRQ